MSVRNIIDFKINACLLYVPKLFEMQAVTIHKIDSFDNIHADAT